MSALELQAREYMSYIPHMTEDELRRLVDFFQNKLFISSRSEEAPHKGGIRVGLFSGTKYMAEGHDFDEANDEIADLFGVEE